MPDFAMIVTLATLAVAVILLAGNLLRNDLVAVLVILALMLSGVLKVPEALSGFSNNAVIIIACMFIIGQAIMYTGITQRVGEAIIKYGGTGEKKLLITIMTAASTIGAFTGAVATAAMFIPITLTVAEKAKLNHKRLLMPLAAAALISGMMTLVAKTTNIIMNSILREQGLPTLSFFSFTPFGVLTLVLSILFMLFIGQDMLAPKGAKVVRKKGPSIDDLLEYYHIAQNEYLLQINADSSLVGSSISSLQLGSKHHVTLLAVESNERGKKRSIKVARPEITLQPGDLLIVIGMEHHVTKFIETFDLSPVSMRKNQRRAFFQVIGIAEVMLTPYSTLIGKSVKELVFQSTFHSMVLGVRRKGSTFTDNIAEIPLQFGDILLVCGSWTDILRLDRHKEQYFLLTLPRNYKEVIPLKHKETLALIILLCMIGLMVFNILPPVAAILTATTALVLTRCIPLTSVYNSVDWQVLVMVAGILPLALALQKTGVTSVVSSAFLYHFSSLTPLLVLASLYCFTAALGLFIPTTAVAALVGPMAVDIGLKLNIHPHICALAVAIACSATFISPLSSSIYMAVREPGGYVFKDYAKVGIPLFGLSLAATLFLAWILYL